MAKQKFNIIFPLKSGTKNNMPNSKDYVPILKWKRAEQRALKDLKDEDRERIIPLVELVMPKVSSPYKDKERKVKKTREETFSEIVSKFKTQRTKEIPEEIKKSWGDQPIFIDFSLLYEAEFTIRLKVESITTILSAGYDLDLNLIPVINLNDEKEIKDVACELSKKYGKGLCLRITTSDLADIEKLNGKLKDFLGNFRMSVNNIDLLIDLKSIQDNIGEYLGLVNLSQKLVDITDWRGFIFAAGAFPEDLSKCKFDEATLIPRLDWKQWLQHNHGNGISRIPTFADYTIRNPIYKESDQFYAPTTSIRYTLEDDWMIMKGKRQDFKLYLVNAKLLAGDSDHFSGEAFSAGDKYIAEKARHYDEYIKNPKIKGTGGSEDWIYVGINHHLTLTAHQLANLP